MQRIFNQIAASTPLSIGLILLLSSLYFIGLSHVHLFDWDEINFAESAREMIASGDYMKVQINFMPFWEKPPFFFWLQAASMHVFGVNEFAARFPNAVFGIIYLLSFYFIGRRHISAQFGLLWALLFFGTILPHLYFKSGIIDPVFNYFIFISVYFMMRALDQSGKSSDILFAGIFSGLSVLTKGPVGFLLLGLTCFVFLALQSFRAFPSIKRILFFVVGLASVVLSWLSIEFYQNGTENMLRFLRYMIELFNSGVAGHEQPFYYHFIVVFLGCFPISVLGIPYLLRKGLQSPMQFHRWMQVLFWVVMIVFSITTTKIVHYSSMTYAPLSFLGALFVYGLMNKKEVFKKYQMVLLVFLASLWSLIFIALPLVMRYRDSIYHLIKDPFAVAGMKESLSWSGLESLIGVLFLSLVTYGLIQFRKKQYLNGVIGFVKATAIVLILVLFIYLPKIESFSQGPAIEFFKQHADEDAYFETFAYKSYAQYFYAQQQYGSNPQRTDINWLLKGDIDQPVYFVSKVTNKELDEFDDISFLGQKGGFRFYKRMPAAREYSTVVEE
jgi:hypothetical protein